MKRTKPFQVTAWVRQKLNKERNAEALHLNNMMTKGRLSPQQSADAIAFFLQSQMGADSSIIAAIGAEAFYSFDNLETGTVN